ncbi:hypothetical protein EG832_17600 [bacterium]|nr:hypothetical protein [bacterium]
MNKRTKVAVSNFIQEATEEKEIHAAASKSTDKKQIKRINLAIPEELYLEIRKVAFANDMMNISATINMMLENYVKSHPEELEAYSKVAKLLKTK